MDLIGFTHTEYIHTIMVDHHHHRMAITGHYKFVFWSVKKENSLTMFLSHLMCHLYDDGAILRSFSYVVLCVCHQTNKKQLVFSLFACFLMIIDDPKVQKYKYRIKNNFPMFKQTNRKQKPKM